MARESQRLQVGLIICVMLIVVLLGLSFILWRNGNELKQQVVAKDKAVNDARAAEEQLNITIQYLKAMLGAGETMQGLEKSGYAVPESLAEVKTNFDNDMKLVGQGMPEDQHNYMAITKNLFNSLARANEQKAEADAQIKAALAERDRRIAEMTQRVNTAEEAQKTAENNLAAANAAFASERQEYIAQSQQSATQIDELTKKTDEVQKSADAARTKYEAAIGQLEKQLQAKNQQLEKYVHLNLSLEEMERLDVSNPFTMDSPDGKIINVNQTQRSVWLNIGGADGLRPRATFTVYDSQASGAEAGAPKARIEVTRILGGHQAEARILEDHLTNPIMRGDIIYSPAFRAGRKVHFALAGVIDLNDDGVSDRDLVRNLIGMNGGVVDAEQLDDGTISGSISASTRYLIMGEQPSTDAADPAAGAKLLEGYSEVNKQALAFGVKTLKVEEFLDLMGWKPEVETVNLGRGANLEADEANAFRRRRPPTGAATEENPFGSETSEGTEENPFGDSTEGEEAP